jgi:glyoxylase-like metal-dependent hydrolase (beta-lactamase superfamily II)
MKIQTIDLQFQGTPGLIAAHVIESGGELALVETGPGSCREALVNGLQALGISPAEVRKVFVTHIHLDHSGGVGWWAQQGSQVYVHGRGAAHLIDPTKLIDSATRIYGDDMQRLWGDILPAPAEQVTVLGEGDRVGIGDVTLEAWDTPGHARHHLAFKIENVCFTGDVAGVRLAGCDYLSVAAAPPQFEPGPYLESVRRLLGGHFDRLYLAHFGLVEDAENHLARYSQRITEVYERVDRARREGLSSEAIAQRYLSAEKALATGCGVSEADWLRYELANGSAMCASGVELYCNKHSG